MKKETYQELANKLFTELFPICRSITGNGVRETLKKVSEVSPFDLVEIPTGTQCFDWTIPREWVVRDAYIKLNGEKIVDFKESNVHLVSYSAPIKATMSFQELLPHLHTLKHLPEAIPYRTSYYKENWGFCVEYNRLKDFPENGTYEVVIDSELINGSLTYAQKTLPGSSKGKEFLITSYCCHPSLANDNLSGVVLLTLLKKELESKTLKNTYHFVIAPETIGALAYISQNFETVKKLEGGLVLTTVAGPGPLGIKQTFKGDSLIDRAAMLSLKEKTSNFKVYPFVPDGSDERQYSSPGLRIPALSITKDKYYEYDYYHTSLDNLSFAKPEYLVETLAIYVDLIEKLENNATYKRKQLVGEIQLGKRGLYPQLSGHVNTTKANKEESATITEKDEIEAMSWVLFYLDGKHSVIDMAEKTQIPVRQILSIIEKLKAHDLLEEIHS